VDTSQLITRRRATNIVAAAMAIIGLTAGAGIAATAIVTTDQPADASIYDGGKYFGYRDLTGSVVLN
jgi:hypothetical protein